MIAVREVRRIARARLADAEVLHDRRRFDGAVYLCGYAVELGLKARICRTLKWTEFPSTRKDFQGLESFRTHDLDRLLRLTGREAAVKARYLAEWSAVSEWNPEARYREIGTASAADSETMLGAAGLLLEKL